jgi:hypothetical protein
MAYCTQVSYNAIFRLFAAVKPAEGQGRQARAGKGRQTSKGRKTRVSYYTDLGVFGMSE